MLEQHSFQEVMRQLNRLCSHYQNCDESGCPMFDECGNIGALCSEPLLSCRIEKTVMDWAAEHPEPVYETWFEYLLRIGVIPENAPAGGVYQWIVESIKHKHIPADIAEKLGLQPKEANHEDQT